MVPDWQTNRVFFAEQLKTQFPTLTQQLTELLNPTFLSGFNDLWVRDFLPIQVSPKTFVKFNYRPAYLRAYPELRTGTKASTTAVPSESRNYWSGLLLDGGNVVASSTQVIVTTRVLKENYQWHEQHVIKALEKLLKVEVHFIPEEPHDVYGHADGIARFINDDVLLVNDYVKIDKKYNRTVRAHFRRIGAELVKFPYTPPMDGPASSAMGCYINFLRTRDTVLLPKYNRKEDNQARKILEKLLPGTKIHQIDCTQLAPRGGVLNCISWTINDGQQNGLRQSPN